MKTPDWVSKFGIGAIGVNDIDQAVDDDDVVGSGTVISDVDLYLPDFEDLTVISDGVEYKLKGSGENLTLLREGEQ